MSLIVLISFMATIFPGNSAPLYAQGLVKIAVLNLQANKGLDAMTMGSLTELICTELSRSGRYEVMSRDDMQALLQHMGDQQALTCDDVQCLAKVGNALGVQQLLAGNIGMVGNRYLINIKLIDIENVKVLNRISQEYAGDEGGLIDALKTATAQLCGASAAPAPAPAVPAATVRPAAATGESRCEESRVQGMNAARMQPASNWFLGGLGCGVGCGLLGAAGLWFLANNSESMPDPSTIPADLNAACYTNGYQQALKAKKKNQACAGGVIGALIALVIVNVTGIY
jgi:TolB-like protein